MRHVWYQDADGTRRYESDSCPVADERATGLSAQQVVVAFQRLPLPASTLHIEPGGGRTRVNFDTIFYTTAKPFTRTISLLGHRITFHITPSAYTWNWGDGAAQQTTWPGRPYNQDVPVADDITHRYEQGATFQPRLDTTYTATYTVDGGPSAQVNGTVTVRGTPTSLRADTYTPVLVD